MAASNNKRKQDEKYLKILRDLVSQPHNRTCFDCQQKGPTYINMTIGSFVCTTCSGVLRGLNPPHRVKSISMASFTSEEVDQIKSRGNQYCHAVWLGLQDGKNNFFADGKDEHKIREFMIAKYERKRFYVDPSIAFKLNQNPPLIKNENTSASVTDCAGKTAKLPAKISLNPAIITLSRPMASGNNSQKTSSSHSPNPKNGVHVGSSFGMIKGSSSMDFLSSVAVGSSSASRPNLVRSKTADQPDPFSPSTPTSTSESCFANFDDANIFSSIHDTQNNGSERSSSSSCSWSEMETKLSAAMPLLPTGELPPTFQPLSSGARKKIGAPSATPAVVFAAGSGPQFINPSAKMNSSRRKDLVDLATTSSTNSLPSYFNNNPPLGLRGVTNNKERSSFFAEGTRDSNLKPTGYNLRSGNIRNDASYEHPDTSFYSDDDNYNSSNMMTIGHESNDDDDYWSNATPLLNQKRTQGGSKSKYSDNMSKDGQQQHYCYSGFGDRKSNQSSFGGEKDSLQSTFRDRKSNQSSFGDLESHQSSFGDRKGYQSTFGGEKESHQSTLRDLKSHQSPFRGDLEGHQSSFRGEKEIQINQSITTNPKPIIDFNRPNSNLNPPLTINNKPLVINNNNNNSVAYNNNNNKSLVINNNNNVVFSSTNLASSNDLSNLVSDMPKKPFINTPQIPFPTSPLTPVVSTSSNTAAHPVPLTPAGAAHPPSSGVGGGGASNNLGELEDKYAALKDLDEAFKTQKSEVAPPSDSQSTSTALFGPTPGLGGDTINGPFGGSSTNGSINGGYAHPPPAAPSQGWGATAPFSSQNPFAAINGSSSGGSSAWPPSQGGSAPTVVTTQSSNQINPFARGPDANFNNQFAASFSVPASAVNAGPPTGASGSGGVTSESWSHFGGPHSSNNPPVVPNGSNTNPWGPTVSTPNPFNSASVVAPSGARGSSFNPFL